MRHALFAVAVPAILVVCALAQAGPLLAQAQDHQGPVSSVATGATSAAASAQTPGANVPASPSLIVVDRWTPAKSGWVYVLDARPQPNEHSGAIWLVDPAGGQTMGSIRTGQDPDFALSPDGSRLYVASYASGNLSDLAILDTSNGSVIAQGSIENRATPNGMPAFPSMAVSGDGKLLRLQINSLGETDGYGLAALDAQTLAHLAGPADVGDCGFGRFVGFPDATEFIFLCPMTNRMHRAVWDAAAQKLNSDAAMLPWERRFGVASAFLAPGGQTATIVRGDGAIFQMDNNTGVVTTTPVQGGLKLQGRVLPANWPTSPDGGLVYLGATRSPDNELYLNFGRDSSTRPATAEANEFHIFDTAKWSARGTIRTRLPFWSAAVSPDGKSLYALVPAQHTVLVYDTGSLQEGNSFEIGGLPVLALVAP